MKSLRKTIFWPIETLSIAGEAVTRLLWEYELTPHPDLIRSNAIVCLIVHYASNKRNTKNVKLFYIKNIWFTEKRGDKEAS